MDRWVGKIAVVTGASSGIGEAIAKQLVENGLIVIGIARRLQLIEEQAKQLSDKKGKLFGYKADISKKEEVIEAFKWIKSTHGPVSILVNNAGLGKYTNLIDGDADVWKSILDLNVFGLCVATKEAIKSMKDNNINGHVILMNSFAGHIVPNIPGINLYPASKFAVTAIRETLRHELVRLGSKIRVTSISPGLVVSELTTLAPNTDPTRKSIYAQMPILQSEDIADGVIYTLSTPEHVQVLELTIKPVGEVY